MKKNNIISDELIISISAMNDQEILEKLLHSSDYNNEFISLLRLEAKKRNLDLSIIDENNRKLLEQEEEELKVGISPSKKIRNFAILSSILFAYSLLTQSSIFLYFIGPLILLYFGISLKFAKRKSNYSGKSYSTFNKDGRIIGVMLIFSAFVVVLRGFILPIIHPLLSP